MSSRSIASGAGRAAAWVRSTVILLSALLLASCGGGAGGGYGSDPDRAPIAVASVINTGAGPGRDATVKSGAEILLSGKDTDGTDSPAIRFQWQQIDNSGFQVTLVERTSNTVAFNAPRVTQRTALRFRLDVFDAEGDVGTATVTVNVEPAGDADRFLTYINSDPDSFVLVASLARGTRVTSDLTFAITQQTGVTYPDRTAGGVPNRTLILDDVPRSLSSAFVNGTDANWNSLSEAIDAFYSPRFVVRMPNPDVDDINKRYESSNRNLRIEPEDGDLAQFFIDMRLSVSGGSCLNEVGVPVDCAGRVNLFVLRRDGSRLAQQSDPLAYRVNLQDLASRTATQPGQTAAESRDTGAAYYRAVDPDNKRTTLSDWMALAGFTQGGQFIDASRYAHATYVNNFDLGFGRDMYLRVDSATGNVYSFVSNYPTLEAALKRLNNFATVVMEFSPPDQDPSLPKFVKFFAFVPDDSGDQVRRAAFNFDGRGEKWAPGVCTVCHGGRPTFLANGEYANFGNVNATFLPWDLDSLLYTDSSRASEVDPDLNRRGFTSAELQRWSRQSQEAQFKLLNQGALATYQDPARTATPAQLVYGWYGDTVAPFDSLPSATFNGQYIQPGWVGQETLYHTVFARYCRSCHTNNDTNTFANVADLVQVRDRVRELVFEEGTMPLARLTHDRLWVNFSGGAAPVETLRTTLTALGENVAGMTPGMPVARIASAPQIATRNQMPVRLDGSVSAGADSYRWRFASRPAASQARLVGPTTTSPAFMIDQPGNYVVELIVANARGDSTPAMVTVRAASAEPFQTQPAAGIRPSASVAEGGVVPIGSSVVRFQDIDNGPSELVYTITTQPLTGQIVQTQTLSTTMFTQQDVNDGLVEYRHNGAENTLDEATFTLSDGGSTAEQRFQFIVLPVNDAPTLIRNLPIQVAENGFVVLNNGALSVADADNTPMELTYNVLVAPIRGSLSQLSFTQDDIDFNRVRYTHFGGEEATDTVRLSVTDGAATLSPIDLTFNVIPVADSPTAINTGPFDDAIRGRVTTITVNDLQYRDVDTADSGLVYTVVLAPANGTLTNGSTTLTTFTQQNINDGNVRYRNNGDVNDLSAASSDSFVYDITDGTTTLSNNTLAIVVNPAPDAPMRGLSDLMLQASGVEDPSLLTSADLNYTSTSGALVTYTVQNPPQNGTLRVNGVPAQSFTQNDINLGRVSYLPNGLTVTTDSFAFRASAQVSPGVTVVVPAPNLAAETFSVTVRVSFSRDVTKVFRTRHDPNARACIECHCNTPDVNLQTACSIVPPLAEALQPALMPVWAADPALASGLLQQILLNTAPGDLENSPVLRRGQGLDAHPAGERAGFDVNGDVNGDRSRYDLLLRWMQEGCRGPNDQVSNCVP